MAKKAVDMGILTPSEGTLIVDAEARREEVIQVANFSPTEYVALR
jgi:hypothetical protein